MIKVHPRKPKAPRKSKAKTSTTKIQINVQPKVIKGHGQCTVFETHGRFFAKTSENTVLTTTNFGKTWINVSEAEANAFEILLHQYSEQEKRKR